MDLGELVNAQRAQVSRAGGPRRKQKWSVNKRLRGLEIPMAPKVNVLPATEGMPAQAQTDGTNVYVQGRADDRTMAHEIAHNLDAQVMTDSDRKRFAMVMGRPDKPWDVYEQNGGYQTTSHGSMSERFADMVAMLATKDYPKAGRGGGFAYLDDPPSRRELLRFGRALERLGRRNNLGQYKRPS
jgi:hypothetical protein